jgi:hypothetical protein
MLGRLLDRFTEFLERLPGSLVSQLAFSCKGQFGKVGGWQNAIRDFLTACICESEEFHVSLLRHLKKYKQG